MDIPRTWRVLHSSWSLIYLFTLQRWSYKMTYAAYVQDIPIYLCNLWAFLSTRCHNMLYTKYFVYFMIGSFFFFFFFFFLGGHRLFIFYYKISNCVKFRWFFFFFFFLKMRSFTSWMPLISLDAFPWVYGLSIRSDYWGWMVCMKPWPKITILGDLDLWQFCCSDNLQFRQKMRDLPLGARLSQQVGVLPETCWGRWAS